MTQQTSSAHAHIGRVVCLLLLSLFAVTTEAKPPFRLCVDGMGSRHYFARGLGSSIASVVT
jgi:hypothetical protein